MKTNGEFTTPETHSFEQIIEKASQLVSKQGPMRAALAVPSDMKTLRSFILAAEKGLIEPHLVGDEKLAVKNAGENDINIEGIRFIDIREPNLAVQAAAKMAIAGEIDIFVNGRVPAIELLKQLLEKETGFVDKGRILSHVAVMKPSLYKKLLLITDAAVNMEPDLKTKLAIIDNAVNVANLIGIDMPRVAVIAAVEVVYPQMPVTMDAAIISKMADRKQIRGAYVDGPLSFDVAVDMFAAHSKGITDSMVAGQADILLAPDIATANGVYRAMSLYGNAVMGGVVIGGKVPVVLSSRSDSVENRLNSITLGVLTASQG